VHLNNFTIKLEINISGNFNNLDSLIKLLASWKNKIKLAYYLTK